MIFTETELPGAFVIELEKFTDERGFFARSWCTEEFESHGLNPRLVQCNISQNTRAGTLRGMHLQGPPREEAKLVRCTRGSIYDVIVDLRPDSKAFKRHVGITLSRDNYKMLYIPEGFAHGFITLEDDTEIFYQMSEVYSPEHALGYRWDDPAFGIEWPGEITVMSERDRNLPLFLL